MAVAGGASGCGEGREVPVMQGKEHAHTLTHARRDFRLAPLFSFTHTMARRALTLARTMARAVSTPISTTTSLRAGGALRAGVCGAQSAAHFSPTPMGGGGLPFSARPFATTSSGSDEDSDDAFGLNFIEYPAAEAFVGQPAPGFKADGERIFGGKRAGRGRHPPPPMIKITSAALPPRLSLLCRALSFPLFHSLGPARRGRPHLPAPVHVGRQVRRPGVVP